MAVLIPSRFPINKNSPYKTDIFRIIKHSSLPDLIMTPINAPTAFALRFIKYKSKIVSGFIYMKLSRVAPNGAYMRK